MMTEITCTMWRVTCFNTCLIARSEVNSFVFPIISVVREQ